MVLLLSFVVHYLLVTPYPPCESKGSDKKISKTRKHSGERRHVATRAVIARETFMPADAFRLAVKIY